MILAIVTMTTPARHVEVMPAGAMPGEFSSGAVPEALVTLRAVVEGKVTAVRSSEISRPTIRVMGPMVGPTRKLMVPRVGPCGKVTVAWMVTESGNLRTAAAVVPMMAGVAVARLLEAGKMVMSRSTVVVRGVMVRAAM